MERHRLETIAATGLALTLTAASADAVRIGHQVPCTRGIATEINWNTPDKGVLALMGEPYDHRGVIGVRNLNWGRQGRGDLGRVFGPHMTEVTADEQVAVGTLVGDADGAFGVSDWQLVAAEYDAGTTDVCRLGDGEYYVDPGSLALAGSPDDNFGVIGLEPWIGGQCSAACLVRFYSPGNPCTDPVALQDWELIDTHGVEIAAGTLISDLGKVFAIGTHPAQAQLGGRIGNTWNTELYEDITDFGLIGDLRNSHINTRPGSLALGGTPIDNYGIFAVRNDDPATLEDESGQLFHARWTGVWEVQIVPTYGWKVAPGSLISGPRRVYGVTQQGGHLFNTWIDAGQVRFEVDLDAASSDFVPESLTLAGTPDANCGLFALKTDDTLWHTVWNGSSYTFTEVVSGYNEHIEPRSLISGPMGVYGVSQCLQVVEAQCVGAPSLTVLTDIMDW